MAEEGTQAVTDRDTAFVGGTITTSESGTPDSVEAAAKSPQHAKAMPAEEQLDAMAWLLQDDPFDGELPTQTWRVNVGTDEQPKMISWTIRPVDGDEMNRLRQDARDALGANRQVRRRSRATDAADFDVTTFNRRLVATATVEPNLAEAAEKRGLGSADPLEGPVMLLGMQFRFKPGLIDQIAAYVMEFSGFNDEDVSRATPDVTMLRAAGN